MLYDGCDPSLRFSLATAAHRFLIAAIPFRHPDTGLALSSFLDVVRDSQIPAVDVDAILLRCLTVLDRHTGGRLPNLVDRFLRPRGIPASSRFRDVIEDVIRYRGIGNPDVQRAIAIMEERSADSGLRQHHVAKALGITASRLSVAFKQETGVTCSEYLRDLRLDRAVASLTLLNVRVKDAWVSAGYNHASNFDHDFKRRFGVTPTEYRNRVILPGPLSPPRTPPPHVGRDAINVLVVDDDDSTRDTIRMYLHLEGYNVNVASTGEECLAKVAAVAPDAILLDYHLPGMDGIECLRLLRTQTTSASTSVAIFTADWQVEGRSREISDLRAVVVSKLCDLDEIGDVINTLCRFRRH